jgi:hypothetical protein
VPPDNYRSGLIIPSSFDIRPSSFDIAAVAKTVGMCLGIVLLVAVATGCQTRCVRSANDRPFIFKRDTFAYPNQVITEKIYDASGKSHERRNKDADYVLRCFVMARSARQFFQFAQFDPARPSVDDKTYRKLVREVVSRDPMDCTPGQKRTVIPGFTNLYQFSAAKRELLQETCGSQLQSYFQRGHWRMVLPFSGSRRAGEARILALAARNNRPPVVHVVSFPSLSINHAVLLYDVRESATAYEFPTYDPNDADRPLTVTFDRKTKRFTFPRTSSFGGGTVNVYEIYRARNY